MLGKAGEPIEFVKCLKKHGVDFKTQEAQWGNTALLWAIANAHNHMAIAILHECQGEGINLQDKNSFKNTPLHLLVAKGYKSVSASGQKLRYSNLEVMKELVRLGADLNIRNGNGDTPLHLACLRRDCDMVRLLIENGAWLDILNKQKETPLQQLNKNYEQAKTILRSTSIRFLLDQIEFDTDLEEIKKYLSNHKK